MRLVIAVVVVVAGCGSSSGEPAGGETEAPITRLDLPRMDESSHVMVLSNPKPTVVVWVGAKGAMTIEAGAIWDGKLAAPTKPPADDPRRAVLQAIIDGGGPHAGDARTALDGPRAPRSGRTVRRRPPANGGPAVPGPGRMNAADAIALERLPKIAPLIIATPSAPAREVALLLQGTGGALAVDHLGKLAVMAMAFETERERPPAGTGSWLELAVDKQGVHLIVQPENRDTVIAWAGAVIDRAGLIAAYLRAGAGKLPIDVIVREDTTMQTLVEVLAALRAIDVRQVAIAAGPSTTDERIEQIRASQRAGGGNPSILLGIPNKQGDLDKVAITTAVITQRAKLQACYERGLLRDPSLAGTVQVMFFITPAGNVASATASGVDVGVARCVEEVFRGMAFPLPSGGGGVQVNYPLTFRS